MGFGQQIRDRREELGLDQLEVAKKVGVRQSSVCDWETGEMRPRLDKIDSLAKALRVSAKKVKAWWIADLLGAA